MSQNLENLSQRAHKILSLLEIVTKGMVEPMSVSLVRQFGRDPFVILISCLLSLRAKDSTTYPICQKLFEHIRTPEQLIAIPLNELEKTIRSIGFFRKKARTIVEVSKVLIERFDGVVPQTERELLSLPGVGRKTANLVRAEGFGIPAICVDVHVHRISNRLGIVSTKTPEETEEALKVLFSQEDWNKINRYLVMWGQNICVPVSPWCSRCVLAPLCERRGVTKRR